MSRRICVGLATFANRTSKFLGSNLSLKRQLSRSKTAAQRNILYSAVCVERVPVITPEKSDLEDRFANLSATVELENSYFSDHEARLQREEKSSKKAADDQAEGDEGQTETALDLEDKWDAEYKTYEPMSRTTPADESDDRKSLNRKLDSSLYLLVKQNIEGRNHWVLPQATWEDGETMRQTAERALKDVCGDVKATFLGNAPCAVAKYEPLNPEEERGIKLFFFKAWFREGSVTPNERLAEDYMWVTKDELPEYCHNGYRRNLKKFLL